MAACKNGVVDVIIPNYNYAHYVGGAIDSVIGQTYKDVDIIVVDDGSTDGSAEVLKQYEGRVKAVSQQNQGVSAARNNGAALGSGEFIAFLDADDLWQPEKLELQVGRFNSDDTLGLVHTAVTEVDGEGNILRERFDGGTSEAWRNMLFFADGGVLGGGSGVMIRRSVFDEVGGFDIRLSTAADWDLYFRIALSYGVGFIGKPLLKYRIHGSNMHANVSVMEHDMNVAFDKAFRGKLGKDTHLKRRSYAVLDRILAASYFRAGNYGDAVRTAAKSVMKDPSVMFLGRGLGREGRDRL